MHHGWHKHSFANESGEEKVEDRTIELWESLESISLTLTLALKRGLHNFRRDK